MANQSDLMVITKAKNLSDYILTITQKSPKQFRFSLVGRLQNYALDIVELLYEANDVFAQNVEKYEFHTRKPTSMCRCIRELTDLPLPQGKYVKTLIL